MSLSDPLSVFLISSGSRGDRLLFRYPYETGGDKAATAKSSSKNPFAVRITEDHRKQTWPSSNLCSSELIRFNDDILGNLLAVKTALCGKKFEVKINDVIFVGFPLTLQKNFSAEFSKKRESIGATCFSFHIVFALKDDADRLAVQCYQDLCKQLAVALRHEEKRCSYLSSQKYDMWAIQDEVATCPEDSRECPHSIVLQRSTLAQKLKAVYDSLCTTGIIQLHINKWVQISFCLPHKAHNVNLPKDASSKITPEVIQCSISALRPFHGMLLLESETSLLQALPLDSSPALLRLVSVTTPLKSLYQLASDADLSLSQVYKLVIHLVYWGKAAVIFPLCESNVYILAPNANTYVLSSLGERFVSDFPSMSLAVIMSEFSLPTPLGEHRDILGLPQQQAQQVQMVVWMLRERLLVQLHTYIFLLASPASTSEGQAEQKPSSPSSPENGKEDVHWQLGASDSQNDGIKSNQKHSKSHEASSQQANVSNERESYHKQTPMPSFLPSEQMSHIMQVPAASNSDDLKLFIRLCPYFNGKCHLEEIMYYENLRRSQLVTILDKFRDVLVLTQHEDPGITSWTCLDRC